MKKLLWLLIPLGLLIGGIAIAANTTIPLSVAKGTVPIGNANGTYNAGSLQAGTNITLDTSVTGQITINSSGGGGGSGGLGTTSPFTAGYIPEATGTNVTLSNSNIFQSASGNIGIGTTTPASTLHVAYDASSTASTNFALQLGTKALSSPSANGTYVGLNVPSSFTGNMIELQNNGTSQFKVTSAGSTLIPSGSLFGAGATSADGGFAIASNNGVELGVGTGKAFIATTAGSKFGQLCVIADAVWGLGQTVSSPTTCGATQAVLVWTGGGLVGIGTSTPIGVLTVQGTSGNLIDVYNGATSEFRITSAGVLTTAGNATISGGTLTAATKVQTNLVSANTTNLTLSGNEGSTAAGDDVTVLNGTSRNTTGAGNATAINIQDTFAPTTGTATFHALHISSIINQTNSASGISRGVFVNPTLTTVADFRALETAAKTVTYSTGTTPSIAYQTLFNPYTYVTSSTTNATLSTSTTVDIKGAPIASTTNLAITNSIGLQIESNAVTASTTNAWAAYLTAPSGATNNYTLGLVGLPNSNVGDYLCVNTTTWAVEMNTATCSLSDRRTKRDIVGYSGALAAIQNTNIYYFKYKPEENRGNATHIGLMAQDLQKTVPEAVTTDKKTGLLGIDYNQVTAVLWNGLQTLSREFTDLVARVDGQDTKIKALQEQNTKQQTQLDKQAHDIQYLQSQINDIKKGK